MGVVSNSTNNRHFSAVGAALLTCAFAVLGGCSDASSPQAELPAATPIDATQPVVAAAGDNKVATERPQTVGEAQPPTGEPSVPAVDPGRIVAGAGASNFVPLTNPAFVTADNAGFLDSSDIVLGISVGDEHRAYPVRQVAYHHIVNDEIRGSPYLITY